MEPSVNKVYEEKNCNEEAKEQTENKIDNTNLENTLNDFLKNQTLDIDLTEMELYKENSSNLPKNPTNNLEKVQNNIKHTNSMPQTNTNTVKSTSNETENITYKSICEKTLDNFYNKIPIPLKTRLFNIKQIIGDKNSIYRAVSEHILESEEDFMMIKFFVAIHVSQKSQIEDLFNNFYMEEYSMNFVEFLERVKDDTFLVGELDLIILAKVLNIEFCIYTINFKSFKNEEIDLNNDYNLYSSLKLVNFIKCKNPHYKIDLLLNNLENGNSEEKKTYHLLSFVKNNPYYKYLLERKSDFNSSLTDIAFYDIKDVENQSFIRNFYLTNYIDPYNFKNDASKDTPKKNFWSSWINFSEINSRFTDDFKLTLMVIFAVLAFLTLRRMI